MTVLFLILLSFLQLCLHTQYIFNQNIYRTKWFTILESQFIGNLELFQNKTISSFYIKCILCSDIMSERSKIWKSPEI